MSRISAGSRAADGRPDPDLQAAGDGHQPGGEAPTRQYREMKAQSKERS